MDRNSSLICLKNNDEWISCNTIDLLNRLGALKTGTKNNTTIVKLESARIVKEGSAAVYGANCPQQTVRFFYLWVV